MARAGASLDAVGEPSGESFRPTSARTLPKNPSQLPLIASFPLCRLLVTLYTYHAPPAAASDPVIICVVKAALVEPASSKGAP
jgi:hypothetical protein